MDASRYELISSSSSSTSSYIYIYIAFVAVEFSIAKFFFFLVIALLDFGLPSEFALLLQNRKLQDYSHYCFF
jgi:hypothetical protein